MTSPLAFRPAAGLLALVLGAAAHAADTGDDAMLAAARHDCTQAAAAWPAADLPRPAPHCDALDALDAYYGLGQPVDLAKARACAFGGQDNAVLAMLYANGQGVTRDLGVARKAVCADEAAPAEIEGRLKHLARMERALAAGRDPGRFDWCDDITSGLMQGWCASIVSRQQAQARDAGQAALVATWPAAQRAAYESLQRSLAAFVKARDGEVDLSGTARAALLIAAEDEVKESFDDLLRRAEAGKLAAGTAANAQAADAALNATWKKLRSAPDLELGTIKLDDIVQAQRAWLKYRDAWVAFGHVRYPALPAPTWLAVLTAQRRQQLQELLGDDH